MSYRIAVPGAAGHTGRFVIAELEHHGVTPVACDRTTDLDTALRDADAVINCAGPFAATADPTITAAVRAGIPYLDVTAELEVVTSTFDRYAGAPVPIVPAAGFFGGLGDLLATAVAFQGTERLTIAYALSGWRPTPGTRATGRASSQRRGGLRPVHTGGKLQFRDGAQPRTDFAFSIGIRPVVAEFTMADSATIPTHLDIPDIDTYMTTNAVDDLHAADPSGPAAVDAHGRSAQTFHLEVVAIGGGEQRRITYAGRDIYAITAPLVVGAALRILAGDGATKGPASLGARFTLDALLGPGGREQGHG